MTGLASVAASSRLDEARCAGYACRVETRAGKVWEPPTRPSFLRALLWKQCNRSAVLHPSKGAAASAARPPSRPPQADSSPGLPSRALLRSPPFTNRKLEEALTRSLVSRARSPTDRGESELVERAGEGRSWWSSRGGVWGLGWMDSRTGYGAGCFPGWDAIRS